MTKKGFREGFLVCFPSQVKLSSRVWGYEYVTILFGPFNPTKVTKKPFFTGLVDIILDTSHI